MPRTIPTDSRFPTGTVTFLFTDIEGSTTLWEQHPDAMQAALACHDRLLCHAIESFDGCIVKGTALAVARDLGNVHLECLVLCNLGMAHDSLARFDEARDYFDAALAIARAIGDRRREVQFLSYLGLLHAHQAKFDDARRYLDASASLLQAVSDRMSLGILLCIRAETEHLAGVPDAAGAALQAADLITTEVGAGPDSELGLALARVRNLLRHEQR